MPDPGDALAAARTVLEGFEKGIFVRDISGDSASSWARMAFPYVQALAVLKTWVDAAALGAVPAPGPTPERRLLDEALVLMRNYYAQAISRSLVEDFIEKCRLQLGAVPAVPAPTRDDNHWAPGDCPFPFCNQKRFVYPSDLVDHIRQSHQTELSPQDVWEGIPLELRVIEAEIEAALQRYGNARLFWSTGDQHRDYIMTRVRSLVSRLEEAERNSEQIANEERQKVLDECINLADGLLVRFMNMKIEGTIK